MDVIVALFGFIVGSFLNVVIHRLPDGRSLIHPRSRCPRCENPIRFYDNIPVLSFLILRGRCRDCREPISWRYPLVEILTALCLLGLYWRYGLSPQFACYGLLILFLIPIAIIDLDRGLILNRLTIPGFILGLPLVLLLHIETWWNVLIGAAGGGLIVWLIGLLGRAMFRKESLGMGDIKLIVMIGVYVGFPEVIISLFFGVVAAAITIFIGMSLRKIRLGDTLPFGPFIAVGSLVYLMWGEPILAWYRGLF